MLNYLSFVTKKNPEEKILILGDFNFNLLNHNNRKKDSMFVKEVKSYLEIVSLTDNWTCKSHNLNREETFSKIDWCLRTNISVTWEEVKDSIDWSDHKCFLGFCKFGKASKPRNQIIPNRVTSENITNGYLKNFKNSVDPLITLKKVSDSFPEKLSKFKTKLKIKDNFLIDLFNNNPNRTDALNSLYEHYRELINNNENKLFSKQNAEAYKFYERFTHYKNFERRDGEIVYRIKNDDGDIISDSKFVNKNLMQTFQEIHGVPTDNPVTLFSDLEPIALDQCKRIALKFNPKKGISYDALGGNLFKIHKKCSEEKTCKECFKKIKLIQNIWSKKFWENKENNSHFVCRLIALNKLFPEVPSRKDYRPIIVISQIIKCLELRLFEKLQSYQETRLNRKQVGFVSGCSIQTNLYRIFSLLRCRKNGYGVMLFIDFKNAYCMVDRTRLYEILSKKEILNHKEISLLKFIHSNLVVKLGEESCRTLRSVPQGSSLSPFLFNIF